MSVSNAISLLGGVALFLFGMALMGEGLKQVAGEKLEVVLYKLSSTPLKAILLGTAVTAVIQSSSATSVMVVGFVNSEMMSLTQAIAVIMGSTIGTSATGWLIALSSMGGSGLLSLLNTETLAMVIAIIGILIRMIAKKRELKHLADIMLGFAVLMMGMKIMSDSVSGLRDSPAFIKMITEFTNPALGILAGALLTCILQSASASVGILQALSATGSITFAVSFPILLGIAFGASLPVLMSAIGSTTAGKRAAFSYLVTTFIGSVFVGVLFYLINWIHPLSIMNTIQDPITIAASNPIIRVIMVVILTPFLPLIEKIVIKAIREDAASLAQNKIFERLESRFLNYPPLAIEQSRLVINEMAKLTSMNLSQAIALIREFDEKGFEEVQKREELVDKFEDRIGSYLLKIAAKELNKRQDSIIGEYLHVITDFERISDHSLNLAEHGQEKKDKDIHFAETAWNELKVLTSAVKEIMAVSIRALEDNDMEMAYRVEPLEEVIDGLCDAIKLNHIERLQSGECSVQKGYVFNDILNDCERVADHCSNIGVAVIELGGEKMDAHEYTDTIKNLHRNNFDEYYAEYLERFDLNPSEEAKEKEKENAD